MTGRVKIYNVKRIQGDPYYFYTIEDFNIETGLDGITISYHEAEREGDTRHSYVAMQAIEALAVGQAIVAMAQTLIDDEK